MYPSISLRIFREILIVVVEGSKMVKIFNKRSYEIRYSDVAMVSSVESSHCPTPTLLKSISRGLAVES